MLETLRLIVEKDGFMGLYRGMGPNFIKLVPTVTVSYIVYEQTLRSLGVFWGHGGHEPEQRKFKT